MTTPYTIQSESQRILLSVLLPDKKLQHPEGIAEAAKNVTFSSPAGLSEPFMPTPCKLTESSAALYGLLACYTSLVCSERYGLPLQKCTIDTDRATLASTSVLLLKVSGKTIAEAPNGIPNKIKELDLGRTYIPYRQLATNIYRTKDNRYFHLHGSMNADKTLAMLGLPPDHPQLNTADREEIVKFFANEVAKYDAHWLDTTANEVYRQAGTICYTPEEFAQTEQGKAIKPQGLWTTEAVNTEKLPVVPWPTLKDQNLRPLAGVKIVDISRVIAAPTITRILASLGATVIRVSNNIEPDYGMILLETNLGKYDMQINLKTPEGKKELAHILAEADVILDGYRPGCMERLGFGRQAVHEMALNRDKGIVYARENCYGWAGPWSPRSGWQQISDCVTGVSWLQGKFLGLDEPVVPLLPNSDYQTGVIGAIAIVQALHKRAHQGGSYNVDVSLNQFNIWYLDLGQYTDTQRADIMAKYPDLHLRHTDEMHSLVKKTIAVMVKSVGKIFGPQNFETINSPKWDVEHTGEPISMTILAPVITFDETNLNYNVGSCPPGSYDSSIGWNVA